MAIYVGNRNKDNILSVRAYGVTATDGTYFEITKEEAAKLVKAVKWQEYREDIWKELENERINISEHSEKFGNTTYPSYKVEDITSRYEKYLSSSESVMVQTLCLKMAVRDFLNDEEHGTITKSEKIREIIREYENGCETEISAENIIEGIKNILNDNNNLYSSETT